LPAHTAPLCDRLRPADHAVRDESSSAFVLAREDQDRIAFGDALATIHCLLRTINFHGARANETKLSYRRWKQAFFYSQRASLNPQLLGNGQRPAPCLVLWMLASSIG